MDKEKIFHDLSIQLAVQSSGKKVQNEEIRVALKKYLDINKELEFIFDDVQELRATEEQEQKRMVEVFGKKND